MNAKKRDQLRRRKQHQEVHPQPETPAPEVARRPQPLTITLFLPTKRVRDSFLPLVLALDEKFGGEYGKQD